MVSYRKKVFFSDLAILIIFLSILFPFVHKTTKKVIHTSLEKKTGKLVHRLQSFKSVPFMVQYLESHRHALFFRVTLIDGKGCVLYDSHIEKTEKSCSKYLEDHPEVKNALKNKKGYEQGFSTAFSQRFFYLAQAFIFQGNTYVLRAAFPEELLQIFAKNFEYNFLIFGVLILFLFFIMNLFIWYRLTKPVQSILDTIRPYNEGKQKFLSKIHLSKKSFLGNDFQNLADTLNALSEKIQLQIENLTTQKNENEVILDSLIEGVMGLDEKLQVTYVNCIASKFLKTEEKKIVGKFLGDCFLQDSYLIDLVKKSCRENKILTHPLVIHEKEDIYLDIIIIPKKQKNGVILVFQDKTIDYKMLQVGKDFIANASHELRTPITIIRGFAETLEDHPELDPEVVKGITEKIVRTCIRLNGIVKSLLTLADLEHVSKIKFKKVNLVLVVENSIHFLQSSFEEVQVEFIKQEEEAYVFVDSNLLELAFINLLENAVKYSNPPIELKIYLEKEGDHFLLKIVDKGVGIPQPDLNHIFERFYRVDKARSRKHGGSGLGLSIVKTIVEKHHGKIYVHSKIYEGSCFTVELPQFRGP